MSSANQPDELVANLKGRLARGGMTYGEAVIADHLISIFEQMAAENRKIERSVPQALPRSSFQALSRGEST